MRLTSPTRVAFRDSTCPLPLLPLCLPFSLPYQPGATSASSAHPAVTATPSPPARVPGTSLAQLPPADKESALQPSNQDLGLRAFRYAVVEHLAVERAGCAGRPDTPLVFAEARVTAITLPDDRVPLKVGILIASQVTGRGGRETAITRLAKEFTRKGHHLSIAMMENADHLDWQRELPSVHVAGLSPDSIVKRRLAAVALFVRRWIADFHPDAILVAEPISALIVRLALAGTLGRRPIVFSWFHADLRELRHAWATRTCDAHLAISEGIAHQLNVHWPRPTTVVYNPSDDEGNLIPCPRPSAAAPLRLLYIGRLHEQKRVDRILTALSGVHARNWTLQIIGDGDDRDDLRQLATTLGLDNKITWSGWQSRPWHTVAEASLLLLTSRMEGFPVLLLEALARGVPIAAMDCDFGPREIVLPGQNGWLLPPGDTGAMATIIDQLCTGRLGLPSVADVLATSTRFRATAVVARIEAAVQQFRQSPPPHPRKPSPLSR